MKIRFLTPPSLRSCTYLVWACLASATIPAHSQITQNPAQRATTLPSPSTIIARDVLVATGDTLSSIAERELGHIGFAPQLAEFNGLIVTAPLSPGNIIRIPIHVPARDEFARVAFSKGSVLVLRANGNSQPVELQRDAEVVSGDTITTGDNGYVSIEFSSGSVVNLQPRTEAVISRLNCLPGDDSCIIDIYTVKGKVTSDVEVRDNQPVDFRISTPYASAAVRGTKFDMEATPDSMLVGVTEGQVVVSTQAQAADLDVGFGSVLESDQPPGDPIALLSAPVFKRVPARVAPGDAVAWWPLVEAESYVARVTNDDAGNQVLTSFGVSEDRLSLDPIDGIDAGDYFLHVRAVDSNGLRGFTSNTRLTVAAIDSSITPVTTTITRQGREFLVSVQNPPAEANGYEIQISSNEAFDDPLSVDVNGNGTAVFRLEDDRVFTRARALVDPYTVSAYGPAASSDE